MKKYLEQMINHTKSKTEPRLLQKAMELFFLCIIDIIFLIGVLVSFLFNKSQILVNVSAIMGILLLLLLLLSFRYFYYYYTGNYETIVGECLEVSYSSVKKLMKMDTEIFVQSQDGTQYRFYYPYKKMLFKKENKLRIIVSDINVQYKREGYIQLNNIILVDKEND